MLQDLTFPDIIRFTTEKLHSNAGFGALEKRESKYASRLINDIAKKASGVFLWVALVVKSLLTGLSNCDRISDIQRRLEEIPGDLEELYDKIFNVIDQFYAEHASQLFQIAREAQGMLLALAFSFADEEDEKLAITMARTPMTKEERVSRYEVIKRRLNSRCKGFLEIPAAGSIMDSESHTSQELDDSKAGEVREKLELEAEDDEDEIRGKTIEKAKKRGQENMVNSSASSKAISRFSPADLKVAYLHRTARDFLECSQI